MKKKNKKEFNMQPIVDLMDFSIKKLDELKKINIDNIDDLRIKEALFSYKKRESKSIKQKELARLVFKGEGVSDKVAEENMSAWCNGKKFGLLKPRHIVKIAKILGVSTDFLLNNEQKSFRI
jgi:hypothetical protein